MEGTLAKAGIEFEKRIASDADRERFYEDGHRGFPVVEYDGESFCGFVPDKIKALVLRVKGVK